MMELRWQVSNVPTVGAIAGVDGKFYRLQCRTQSMVIERDHGGMFWGPWKDIPVSSGDEESK